MKIETFKTFEAWSEAHAIQQLCKWLEKKGQGTDDWEAIARDMLYECFEKGGNTEVGEWTEYGKGIYAHGISGRIEPYVGGYRFRLEINDVEESDTFGKIKVKFYISTDEWNGKKQSA